MAKSGTKSSGGGGGNSQESKSKMRNKNGSSSSKADPAGATNGASTAASMSSNSTKRSTSTSKSLAEKEASASNLLYSWVLYGLVAYLSCIILYNAYKIRMHAINEYGPVIHEFDPYFNYRATEYLYEHGSKKFFEWFDYMVWYPLGRPVGTTIYPGMQFTSVFIKNNILPSWSLNDVCCYVPTWFGVIATALVGAITYECTYYASTDIIQWVVDLIRGSESTTPSATTTTTTTSEQTRKFQTALIAATFAMFFMSIVPAHLMRSVGGGYDNESIANSAMVLTFYFWVRSLRNNQSAWMGALAGIAYFYMVAAWGGYIFVLNLIGVHAAALVAMGRFSSKVYLSYTLFYVIGTTLAVQVPVVGWAPLKSLEQLGPCAVFVGYQLLRLCDHLKGNKEMTRFQMLQLRVKVFTAVGVVGILLVMAVAPKGYFGPLSSRVRGLFVKHTKTGNPLVDSVAEHQAASSRAYFQYLNHVCSVAPLGFLMVLFCLSDSASFLIVWGLTAYFFSHKMVRLILLTAPIGSALGGVAAGKLVAWSIRQWWDGNASNTSVKGNKKPQQQPPVKKGAKSKRGPKKGNAASFDDADSLDSLKTAFDGALSTSEGLLLKRVLSIIVLGVGYILGFQFARYSWRLSHDLSNPSIIVKARLRDGTVIKLDDYREAYWWLRDNTPADSRIMAWWDYGYQITAIANRTTIADGNTWNHEHIALLGKALTASEEEGYQIARHLADYVLIWGGGGGDDLAKSPHLARIANSVYRDHCPAGDPTCRAFGVLDRQGTPSPMMERSLLYRLHGNQIRHNVSADPAKWQEVFRSKYGKVRIYKILGVDEESKAWVEDMANRKCDVPGSWFCPGQYPPGLSDILSRKKDFAQLEDFNRADADEEYQKQYFEMLNNPEKAARKARQLEREMKEKAKLEGNDDDSSSNADDRAKRSADDIYNTWEDTEDTTLMWSLISNHQVDDLKNWLKEDPTVAFIRSRDGRGPMWWAFEQRDEEITKVLMQAGVPHTDRDAKGLTPKDLLEGKSQ